MQDTESALAALKMVDTHSFSAMAVVDSEDGKLVCSCDASLHVLCFPVSLPLQS